MRLDTNAAIPFAENETAYNPDRRARLFILKTEDASGPVQRHISYSLRDSTISKWRFPATGMKNLIVALHFPNPSRSYDAARHCVLFWGYDDSREITFQVDRGTLNGLQPTLESDERSFLAAFDEFREQVLEIAKSRYVRGPQNRYSI